jgi:DinB superfamily
MKSMIIVALVLCTILARAQDSTRTDIKSILLNLLETTHKKKDWFVPVDVALEGVTAEQAAWTDGSGNHSIGQLTHHLIFWNERLLTSFKGNTPPAFNGDNDETFNAFDKESWVAEVGKLDKVLSEWEKAIASSDEEKLKSWYENIANISTHNAYHTGQIIYVRKLQGSWDPRKGVK